MCTLKYFVHGVQAPYGQECCARAGASPTSCNAGWQYQLEKQEGGSDRVKSETNCMFLWVFAIQ